LFSEDKSKSEGKSRIEELSKSFEFSDRIQLRAVGQGKQESKWTFDPEPVEFAKATSGDVFECRFANLPKRAGVPFVVVTGEIVSETGARTPASGKSTSDLTKATPRWPVDDPDVKKLAAEITIGCKTPREKVDALLRWLLPGKNIRFEGPVVGSRWGVKKALDQHFGHCWDFSDVFVTLCRASDIPCRQVLGWLYGSEGHVWAEVLVDDPGWLAVDPTTAGPCGSDYVPFVSTATGEMPLVYASPVSIEVENARLPAVE
jgi:transglutaminase-like putative cysteine protease